MQKVTISGLVFELLQEWLQQTNRWRSLAIIALMIMELTWITLWLSLFIGLENQISYSRAFIVLGILMASIYFVVTLMNFLDLNLFLSRAILFLLLIGAVITGLEYIVNIHLSDLPGEVMAYFDEGNSDSDVFGIILFTLFVSWKAISLASRQIGSELAVGGFRNGTMMLLGYGLFTLDRKVESDNAFYMFLFSGLLAMSLTRIASIGQFRGGQQIPYNWRWMGGIIISALTMLGIAFMVNRLVDAERFEMIARFISLIGYGLVFLISPLMWVIIRGFAWIFELIKFGNILEFLINAYLIIKGFIESALVVLQKWFAGIQRSPFLEILGFFGRSRYLLVLGGILLMIIIIVLAMRRYRSNQIATMDEGYQSLLDQQDLFSLLKDALRRGLDRIMDGLNQVLHLQSARRLLVAARIRRIYASLMKLSARLGNSRPPSRTPIEFLPPLQRLFPQLKAELEAITFTYVKVRYGELPESNEEMEAIEQAWRRVLVAGKEMTRAAKF